MTTNSGFDIFFNSSVLTLNLPNATPPVMTRLDLSKTPSFQFGLADDKTLQFRAAPEALPAAIATFASHDEAAHILAEISAALQGKSKKQSGPKWWNHTKRALRWILMICGVFFILLALYSCVQAKIVNNAEEIIRSQLAAPAENAESKPSAKAPAGEPVAADDFLADPVTPQEGEGAR